MLLSKDDFIKRLRESPMYQQALKSVDPSQAKRIAELAEGFLTNAIGGLLPLLEQANDPETAKAAQEALNSPDAVINIEPETSGSKDSG